jgi:hypothetical protein
LRKEDEAEGSGGKEWWECGGFTFGFGEGSCAGSGGLGDQDGGVKAGETAAPLVGDAMLAVDGEGDGVSDLEKSEWYTIS